MLSIFKKDNGSITLEAAFLIPIILMFILFLVSMVKISIAEMALDEAVTDTAETVAHYSFLSLVAEKKIQQTTDGFVDDLKEGTGDALGNNQIADHFLGIAADKVKGSIPTVGELMENHASKPLYEKMVKAKYKQRVSSSTFFNPGGIQIVDFSFPNARSDADVVVGAKNDLKIVLPFIEKTVTIKKKAVERAWTGK